MPHYRWFKLELSLVALAMVVIGSCATAEPVSNVQQDAPPAEAVLIPWSSGNPDLVPLVYVHGYMASAASSGSIRIQLAATGHPVWAVDLPGHGEAPGDRYAIGSMDAYGFSLLAALDSLPAERPPILVAHSLGGHAVLDYLARGGAASGVVLVAPLVRLRHQWAIELASAMGMRTLPGGIPRSWVQAWLSWYKHDRANRVSLLNDRFVAGGPPVMLILMARDQVVLNAAAGKLLQGQARVETLAGLDHWAIDHYNPSSSLWLAMERALETMR